MSTDTLRPRRTELKPTHKTVPQLLELALKDTDPVSVFNAGSSPADTEQAIFVVKGRAHIAYLHTLCIRQGLVTDGKAVAP